MVKKKKHLLKTDVGCTPVQSDRADEMIDCQYKCNTKIKSFKKLT